MKKKFAIVLSGCGVFDGAELHESVLTLLAINKIGAEYQAFAPNIPQHHVVNHITGEEMPETRNVLIESARIVRGEIKDLLEYQPEAYDGLIFTGGYGGAKNLSTLAFDGKDLKVNEEVSSVIMKTVEAGKPIGAECITPAFIAAVLHDATVTIGDDKATAEVITSVGSRHENKKANEVCVDADYKLFSTPCYMKATSIVEVAEGIEEMVKQMVSSIS